MFLFLDDWKKYPNAIVDTSLHNETWLRTASLLKEMKVKNYFFPLALLNKDLLDVDPYSENLTLAEKTMISYECYHNPWYYFRRVHRVPDGSGPLKFRLNRPTLSLLWCFFCGIDYALIMPRQNGKSVLLDAIMIWLIYIYYRDTNLFLLTKDDKLRKETIERIKKTIKLLPEWLIPLTNKDADNTEVITCVTRGNTLTTKVSQKSEDEARKVGRGGTYAFTLIDEMPYVNNINLAAPSLSSATDAARENNELAGLLHGSIITTTAGKLDSKEGAYAKSFIYSGMFWNEILYECVSKDEARQMVRANSSEDRCLVHGTFSHRQCGRTDEWLRNIISKAKRTVDEIARDYLNVWTNGTESSVLSAQILEILTKHEEDPKFVSVSKEKFLMNWYIDENERHNRLTNHYTIIGLDSSEAVGRDANGLVIADIRDLSVIATSIISEASLLKYALWLAKLMIEYPKTILVIEAKSSARAIIDVIISELLKHNINPFTRIFNKVVDDYKSRPTDFVEISKPNAYITEATYLKFKRDMGFNTNKETRAFLYNTVLNECTNSISHLIKDKTITSQLKGLIIKNDRVDHLPNAHDDMVIALLLCFWFLKYAKNLQFYGINPLNSLSLLTTDGSIITEEELENRTKLTELTKEINIIKDRLLSSNSLTETERDTCLLEYTVKQTEGLGNTNLSIDSLLNEIQEARNNRLRNTRNSINSRYTNNTRLRGLFSN